MYAIEDGENKWMQLAALLCAFAGEHSNTRCNMLRMEGTDLWLSLLSLLGDKRPVGSQYFGSKEYKNAHWKQKLSASTCPQLTYWAHYSVMG